MERTAILFDGDYFLKRYTVVYGKTPIEDGAARVSKVLSQIVHEYQKKFDFNLYKIFYYDCYPVTNVVSYPISGLPLNFSKNPLVEFRNALFYELKRTRKVVMRFGHLKENYGWLLKPSVTKEVLKGKKTIKSLKDEDFYYDLKQKGVDMKIGLDVASLAYKKLVDQIILVAGDSDFVPAAKIAREEGIDFILDPMWQHIDDTLFEHIDGMASVSPNPNNTNKTRRRKRSERSSDRS